MSNKQTFPRDLTTEEHELASWMIEHGNCDTKAYASQLKDAKVISQCKCGCASIDFAIGGVEPDSKQGMEILGDYIYGDQSNLCGAFVFACGGMLAGLEVYPLAVDEAPRTLPDPSELKSAENENGT